MKLVGKLVVAAAFAFAVLQSVRPGIPAKSATAEIEAPPEVVHLLEKDCYSCHSDQRRLAWFDEVEPAYWLVQRDVLTARAHLNFSTLGLKPAAAQKASLFEAVNMVQLGAMPLPRFVALHPDSKVTPEDLSILKAYLAPWSAVPDQPHHEGASAGTDVVPDKSANLAAVLPEFNGLAFEGGFESWKPISFTDRGDNNTFRFILGNDVAVKAARSANISPWPDGTRFAKIAWQQEVKPDSLIYPGKFLQVEFMVKDARLYKKTAGWSWGRWRGLDLKPYGKDAGFTGECTSCHLPVRLADYVYTLPMTPARASGQEVVNNRSADLPPGLPFQPLLWSAVTMYVDPAAHTMATLFGNDEAMRAVRAHVASADGPSSYLAGSVLALVTWVQREDPHWFGGRIPDVPRSIEFVEFGAPARASSYRRYDGPKLVERRVSGDVDTRRRSFISRLAPARLP